MLLQAMQVLLPFEKYSGPDRKRFLLLQLPAVAAAANTFFLCTAAGITTDPILCFLVCLTFSVFSSFVGLHYLLRSA
jgi:hypothetical protein